MVIAAATALAVVVPLGAFAYIKSGIYNAAASRAQTKVTVWVTHETMIHSVRSLAKGIDSQASVDVAQVRRGICRYEEHCVACHGESAAARAWPAGRSCRRPTCSSQGSGGSRAAVLER